MRKRISTTSPWPTWSAPPPPTASSTAREAGLKLVAHAGEEGPAAYVAGAVDMLEVDRIDHGNRAMEDQALVRRLAERGITLTVCPLSNLRLRGVADLRQHPL